MRKFMVVAIPVVALALFVAIMLSGEFLKQSFGADDNIPQSISTIINDVGNNNWKAASVNNDKLNKAWNKVIRRIQFSSERDEINALSVNIARLKGAIMAKDKSNALSELNEAYEHWEELGE